MIIMIKSHLVNVDARGKYLGKCNKQHSEGSCERQRSSSLRKPANAASIAGASHRASAHAKPPATAAPAVARDEPASHAFGMQRSSRVRDVEVSEDERTDFRERLYTSPSALSHTNSESISSIRRRIGAFFASPNCLQVPIVASNSTETASISGPTTQKLRRQCDPREMQMACRALVTHVLRVEPALEPTFALSVTSITICSDIVRAFSRMEEDYSLLL